MLNFEEYKINVYIINNGRNLNLDLTENNNFV